MKKEPIILIGGGGHCHSVIDVIEQEDKYTIIGIVDVKENVGKTVLGYSVIGCDEDLETLFLQCPNVLITIGHIQSNQIRVDLFNRLKKIGFHFPIIISPLAYVSQHANIEEGTVVMHQALINANVNIGKNCIINTKALIEHDATVEEHCHISTGCIINGNVKIEAHTFVGSNATTKEGATINQFVKAGSVIR